MFERAPETTYRITVQRSAANRRAEQTYTVTLTNPKARLLDVLLNIRATQDQTLCFRYSCRVGMCGSCAMVVNGRERLACQVVVSTLGTKIRVAPLRSLPVKRDLVPDMAPFFAAIKRSHAAFVPTQPDLRELQVMPPGDHTRATIEAQNGCITCGACFSACEWTRTHPGYLGPAVLNRLLMLALDERDAKGPERLKRAAAVDGVLRCHTLGSCSAVCPVDIPLKTGMQRLKGLVARGV